MSENIGTYVEFGEYKNGILVKTLQGTVYKSSPVHIMVRCENGNEYSLLGGQYKVIGKMPLM